MRYWKTFKNKWTFECSTYLKRPRGIVISFNWYEGSCHPGLYIFIDILGICLDVEFYGPDTYTEEES